MSNVSELPCDEEGVCMVCKGKPPPEETLTCKTCATPWHITCLSSTSLPDNMSNVLQWECPDCSSTTTSSTAAAIAVGGSGELIAAIRAIEADSTLSDQEKARKRQMLLNGGAAAATNPDAVGGESKPRGSSGGGGDVFDGRLNCSVCMQLLDRPVTTPCGHNFCLKCFQRWVGQGKRTCANCRAQIPAKMVSLPRINSALVIAIRMAKISKTIGAGGPPKIHHFVHNNNRPDKAYTTERAKRAGKANACSGKIFVTVPSDHFGPILPENDPVRNQGVLVGESWEDRLECRQWGVHFPHVAGIAGQSNYGAQSVVLSGGYQDDEDHGEWFLYTGSGGRDLSGNKRTNKEQSFDQKFEKFNEALRVSCKNGYPVRVVRSHKEKRSSYAPESGLRYDGVYRIEKCWRKDGKQGFKVCRYLFIRCDNEPAPWTSDDHGDRPRPLPNIKELKYVTDVTERKTSPSWNYDEEKKCWTWKKPPPPSRKGSEVRSLEDGEIKIVRKKSNSLSVKQRLLKEFGCQICRNVLTNPLTTPCGHNFCKSCLEGVFAGQSLIRERGAGRRTLRARKNVMKCPSCTIDIAEYVQNPQVNREMMAVIESLKREIEEEAQNSEDSSEESDGAPKELDSVADEVNEGDMHKKEVETKPVKTRKRKKDNVCNGTSNTCEPNSGESAQQPENDNGVEVDAKMPGIDENAAIPSKKAQIAMV